MEPEKLRKGACLCGAVQFSAIVRTPSISTCHCKMCRRWSTSPFMAVTGSQVAFKGEENVARFRSSKWAERGFCKQCGTNLFYHLVASDDYQMAAGAFDDDDGFRLSLQVFIDDKPDFYAFANETKTMTGAQLAALYAPPEEQGET